jgi:hypothetical protein
MLLKKLKDGVTDGNEGGKSVRVSMWDLDAGLIKLLNA